MLLSPIFNTALVYEFHLCISQTIALGKLSKWRTYRESKGHLFYIETVNTILNLY